MGQLTAAAIAGEGPPMDFGVIKQSFHLMLPSDTALPLLSQEPELWVHVLASMNTLHDQDQLHC